MYFGPTLLPDVTFYMRERDESIGGDNPFKWVYATTKDLFAGKKVVIFGLPGAFTPTCSNSQLPDYEKMFADFQAEGIDEVWCTSVNDAFVMYQWGLSQNLVNVKLLPDGNGDFARELGMLVEKNNLGFGKRSWRYATLVDDLEVVDMWAEEGYMSNCPTDPYGASSPQSVLEKLKAKRGV
jgi:peroxiredoxin